MELPEHFQKLNPQECFTFNCHPGVSCFTECCRQLDLLLTPYDCLRLKNRLGLLSGDFLEQYIIIEWDERVLFPQCYLTMVDDGRASCVFVGSEGCRVYPDRPAACRAYPVGRGASRGTDGSLREQFVLIKEPHCQGFSEPQEQTPPKYLQDQELDQYNRFNDVLASLLHHPRVQEGFRPDRSQLDQFILALYNLDSFRQGVSDDRIKLQRPPDPMELQGLAGDDEQLLLLGIRWLKEEWFGE
jgi:Fe-S-cluster containining protein